MRNKISLAVMLVLMTGVALVSALYRASNDSVYAAAALLLVESIVATFGLYGILFCIAYPLGRLDKYLADRRQTSHSPFAEDRLPTQIIPPVDRAGE